MTKKQKKTSWGEGSMHLTKKQKERAEKAIGKENMKAIDEALTEGFQKTGLVKDKKSNFFFINGFLSV